MIIDMAGSAPVQALNTFTPTRRGSDAFVPLFVAATNAPQVGDPLDENTFQGAQANKRQFETVLRYIEEGKKEGAKIETGGQRIGSKGYFVQPTVFSGVTNDMKIAKEEIFGLW